jgi:hypothetical protein
MGGVRQAGAFRGGQVVALRQGGKVERTGVGAGWDFLYENRVAKLLPCS